MNPPSHQETKTDDTPRTRPLSTSPPALPHDRQRFTTSAPQAHTDTAMDLLRIPQPHWNTLRI